MVDNSKVMLNIVQTTTKTPSKVENKPKEDFKNMLNKKTQKEDNAVKTDNQNEVASKPEENLEENVVEDAINAQLIAGQFLVMANQDIVPVEVNVEENVLTVKPVEMESNILKNTAPVLENEVLPEEAVVKNELSDKNTKEVISVAVKDTEVSQKETKEVNVVFKNDKVEENTSEKKVTVDTIKDEVSKKGLEIEESNKKETVSYVKADTNIKHDDKVSFKVGEAIDISTPKGEKELAETIIVKTFEKNNEFEIQLKPEELGKIKVKLVFEEGKIHVRVLCEDKKAAELLSASSGKIRELVEGNTGDKTFVQVEHKDESAYQQNEQKNNNRNNQNNQEQEQQQERHKNKSENAFDFMQQLRLGLVDLY